MTQLKCSNHNEILLGSLFQFFISSGQSSSDGHNRVSLAEIDVRFPGLIQIFTTNLKPDCQQNLLVNPSTVPILTLLARLDRSTSKTSALSEVEESIYTAVCPYLDSCVIQVRNLAAKIVAQFWPYEMEKLVENVLSSLGIASFVV